MPYKRIAIYDPETDIWAGYFAEVGKWAMTQGENGTLAELSTWFDKLLEDLQAWEREGMIPPLPQPYDDDNCYRWVIDFGGGSDMDETAGTR